MSPSEKHLKAHTIFGIKTFDEYCSQIPDFHFRKGVPEDVVNNFEVVEKLLALSYYEYKFIDEAYSKALLTFEMAMNFRYKAITKNNKNETFNNLITKLSNLNVFDTPLEQLKIIKDLRNDYAHPKNHNYAGIFFWKSAEFINHLINEMYEDVELRMERQKLTKDLDHKLQELNLNRGCVIEIQGTLTILYRLQLLMINNKSNPHTYIFACTPLFDLKRSESGSIIIPHSFKAKLTEVVFKDFCLSGISYTAKERITFIPIEANKALQKDYNQWISEFEMTESNWMFEQCMGHHIEDFFIPELREFQKF